MFSAYLQARAIRSSNASTNTRTTGVISASSSGGIVSGLFSADDMIHVVPKDPFHVQISLSKNAPQGVNDYLCRHGSGLRPKKLCGRKNTWGLQLTIARLAGK